MDISFKIFDAFYTISTSAPRDISIPLRFDAAQPNHFDVPAATATTYEEGNFIGDTRRGGGCNVQQLRLIPHCNGTHTESAGHIVDAPVPVPSILRDIFVPATLITVRPVPAGESTDSYFPPMEAGDMVITAQMIRQALSGSEDGFLNGLIVRTQPNGPGKRSRRYTAQPPPYFSAEAISYIADLPVDHLIVDMPSIDRMYDDGLLHNHHTFWNIRPGARQLEEGAKAEKTITEMVYIADDIPDGSYLACLQIPAFMIDAASSRVFIYVPRAVVENAVSRQFPKA